MADRVLVLEDERNLAELLTGALEDIGYSVVGPALSLPQARELLVDGQFDAAILDLNIAGDSSLALGDELTERGIPWAAVTGYDRKAVAKRPAPVVTKPFHLAYLEEVLDALVAKV